MLKIVISKDQGAYGLRFGLSAAAILYLLSKGSDLIVSQTFDAIKFDERQKDLSLMKLTTREGCYTDWTGAVFDTLNKVVYNVRRVNDDGIAYAYSKEFRTHPDLIDVLEQMGDAANGPYSRLKLVTIDDPNITLDDIEIHDDEGCETIHEVRRIWE